MDHGLTIGSKDLDGSLVRVDQYGDMRPVGDVGQHLFAKVVEPIQFRPHLEHSVLAQRRELVALLLRQHVPTVPPNPRGVRCEDGAVW